MSESTLCVFSTHLGCPGSCPEPCLEGDCVLTPRWGSSPQEKGQRTPIANLIHSLLCTFHFLCTVQSKGEASGLARQKEKPRSRVSFPGAPLTHSGPAPLLACFLSDCYYDTFFMSLVKSLMMPGRAAGLSLNPQQ